MTVKQVQKRLENIRKLANENDDEGAHVETDNLYFMVLTAIADGHYNPMQLAQEALEARKINFDRWCA